MAVLLYTILFYLQLILIIATIVACCKTKHGDDTDSWNEEMPIHPYRENKDLYGHRNEFFQDSPPTTRKPTAPTAPTAYGSQTPDYKLYRGRGGGTEPGFSTSYEGRTELYRGPPNGYDRRRVS